MLTEVFVPTHTGNQRRKSTESPPRRLRDAADGKQNCPEDVKSPSPPQGEIPKRAPNKLAVDVSQNVRKQSVFVVNCVYSVRVLRFGVVSASVCNVTVSPPVFLHSMYRVAATETFLGQN